MHDFENSTMFGGFNITIDILLKKYSDMAKL